MSPKRRGGVANRSVRHIGYWIFGIQLLKSRDVCLIAGLRSRSDPGDGKIVLDGSEPGSLMERIGRTPYWLLLGLESVALAGVWIFFSVGPPIGMAVVLPTVSRLHDIGRSGWWALGLFVPGVQVQTLFATGPELFPGSKLIAIIASVLLVGTLVVIGALPGQPGANRFGAPPR